jgi:2-oxoglutarate ferredoxin oxidoreductase subunit alpha
LKGKLIVRNIIGLGAIMSLTGFNLDHLIGAIKDTFNSKVADLNVKALKMGWNFAQEHFAEDHNYQLNEQKVIKKQRVFLNGNEAIGLGALRAGCKFYVAYPMTPATGLLHFMASLEREYGMIVVHAESEISAINMVAGASFAGVRAMTATSGGGFCLMSEGLGMLGMTETPAVIMLAQRPGPSTGLPTYSGQGDLRFVIHASHGEFPRVVIAPGDVEECFYKTQEAFNLAEKYQIPVIILTDKYLVESYEGVKAFDVDRIGIDRGRYLTGKDYESEEEYQRHKLTRDGISPRAIPGMKGVIVRTNSNEHDENGYTTDNSELTIKMANKRFRKRETLVKDLEKYETVKFYGSMKADVTLFGWGTTKRPIREVMKRLSREALKINFLQIVYLDPFPTEKVRKMLQLAQKSIVVEENKTSQLSSLIREHTLMTVDHEILKYNGRPFNPLELSHRIKEVL